MNVGPGELLLVLIALVVGFGVPFVVGYFIGKGAGFKEGLRVRESKRR